MHEAGNLSAAAFRRLFCPRGGGGAPLLLRGAPCLAGPCGGSVASSAAWSVAGLLASFGPREFTVVDQVRVRLTLALTQQAQINRAEGEKQARVLDSEAERQQMSARPPRLARIEPSPRAIIFERGDRAELVAP